MEGRGEGAPDGAIALQGFPELKVDVAAAPVPHLPAVETELAGRNLPCLQRRGCRFDVGVVALVRAVFAHHHRFLVVADQVEVLGGLLHGQIVARVSAEADVIEGGFIQHLVHVHEARIADEHRIGFLLHEETHRHQRGGIDGLDGAW